MKLTKQVISFESGINVRTASNILPIKNAEMTYNFDFSDGSLRPVSGMSGLVCPLLDEVESSSLSVALASLGEVCRVFYFKKYDFESESWADKLIIFDKNLAMHTIDLQSKNASLLSHDITFTSPPFGVNYRLMGEDVFILASKSDALLIWNGVDAPERIADAPRITSMAVHHERLFVTTAGDSNSLWFSDDLDPSNWNMSLTGAGMIQMIDERGALRRVISFNNYLYVFRDFGISRLTASGAQEDFFVSQLFVSSGKIFHRSICLCGDRIIFCASDGIYQFDGSNTTKILDAVFPILSPSENSCACFFDGKYYLSLSVEFGDDNYEDEDLSTNALLVLDVTKKSYVIFRGFVVFDMVSSLTFGDSKVVFAVSGELPLVQLDDSGEFQGSSMRRVWRSSLSDLSYPAKVKTVRSVHLFSRGNVSLTISSERESATLNLREGVNSYPLLISGRRLCFEFFSEDSIAEVSDIVLEIYM